jgi:DNA-binding MarR family transcriptional regulator
MVDRETASLRADPDLATIREFLDLVASHGRSARQRERVVRAARVPLTGAMLAVLRVISRHEPIAVSELARRMEIDQSTASRQVKALEDHGLLARSTDRDDRRVARLSVTPAACALLERIQDVVLNDIHVALSDWPAEDRAELARTLDRFRASLLAARSDETGWAVGKGPVAERA